MFQIDKTVFGEFVAEQRKAKGYTQKELAEKLFVSDKAVSKWERALSMPDISLLIPLADILEVSVSELLEGRKLDRRTEMNPDQVEILVKKALTFSDETPETKKARLKKHGAIFGGCTLIMLCEIAIWLWALSQDLIGAFSANILIFAALSFGFGIYFWFYIKERLPVYYDENKINAYSDGVFRMNVPGLSFNNGNWPHIVRCLRIWSVITMIAAPLLCLLLALLPISIWGIFSIQMALLIVYLLSLFLPIYLVGRKYNMSDQEGSHRSKNKIGLIVLVLGMLLMLILSFLGFGTSRSGIRIGFVEHAGRQEWSASYRQFDGTMSKRLYPKGDALDYLIKVETEKGELSIELADKDGNIIFVENAMPTGSSRITLRGTTKILISGDNHEGSFSISPE